MSNSTSLSSAISDPAIAALPADQITGYLTQRLQAVRVTLLEATTNRALTEVSVDTVESSRVAEIAQYDKQIESLRNCIGLLEGALAS